MSEIKYTLGLALSGGGIKGLCHVGVLKALDEVGFKPEIISGVSSGSIVGALYADGYTPDEIAELFQDISFREMTSLQIPDGGLFSIHAFEKFIDKTLRSKTFEELNIPLRIVATNLDNGSVETFSSGNLLDPIIASCSIPVLFNPKVINGINYVDGGVLKNFPVSTIRDDCSVVVGVNASPYIAESFHKSIKNVVTRTYHFMFKANILYDKELCDLLIEPVDMNNYDTFDIDKAREIFSLGYESTKRILKSHNW